MATLEYDAGEYHDTFEKISIECAKRETMQGYEYIEVNTFVKLEDREPYLFTRDVRAVEDAPALRMAEDALHFALNWL